MSRPQGSATAQLRSAPGKCPRASREEGLCKAGEEEGEEEEAETEDEVYEASVSC